jgi:hypothetical protein
VAVKRSYRTHSLTILTSRPLNMLTSIFRGLTIHLILPLHPISLTPPPQRNPLESRAIPPRPPPIPFPRLTIPILLRCRPAPARLIRLHQTAEPFAETQQGGTTPKTSVPRHHPTLLLLSSLISRRHFSRHCPGLPAIQIRSATRTCKSTNFTLCRSMLSDAETCARYQMPTIPSSRGGS